MEVRNGHGLLGDRALKSTVSQEWIDEMSWFLACWYKLREAKIYFNNYWVDMVKNGQDLLDHGTLKSRVSHKWFDELSRLIEWFLCADSEGITFGLTTDLPLHLWHLNAGLPDIAVTIIKNDVLVLVPIGKVLELGFPKYF